MISRIDIEDMTDAQDEAPERIWAQPEHSDEPDYGGFWTKARVAPAVEYIRADLARPSQAGDERVARLRAGVERLHKTVVGAWDRAGTLPAKASVKVVPSDWHDLRNQIEALVAAMDTPKGGGDE